MKIADLGQIDLTPGGGSKEVRIRDTTITYGINRDGKTGAIDLVETPRGKRGAGSAREALVTFLKATDAAGITMFLSAEPRDKGIVKSGLVDFYKSLGFKRNSGKHRDFRSMNGMVRQPKTLKENVNQIDTPEFKRWFADSKVVDQNGAPLVVYHGTTADFHTFSVTGKHDRGLWGRGFYFSALVDGPNSYALRQGDGARIIPAYVSIKNPLILKTGKDLITRLPDGTNTRDLTGPNLDGSKIREIADAGGHDGVIQYRPNGLIGDIVAYSPSQIKSAIGNSGAFDSNSLNITEGWDPNQLPFDENDPIQSKYVEGLCYALAIAHHRRYGWPIYVLGASEEDYAELGHDTEFFHGMVMHPSGVVIDITGPHTPADFVERWGEPFFRLETEEVLLSHLGPFMQQQSLNGVAAAMETIDTYLKPRYPQLYAGLTEATYKVYHGTDSTFDRFDDMHLGSAHGRAPINMTGFNFTDSLEAAHTFGANVMPCLVTLDRPYTINARGKTYAEFKHRLNDLLDRVDRSKYDGIIIKDYRDAGKRGGEYILSTHYVPFSVGQIKILNES